MPAPMPAPVSEPASDEPETQAQPERAKPGWRKRLPRAQGRTRNAAPLEDDRLTIDNETALTWSVAIGYHSLDPVGPYVKRQERVVKSGPLSARPMDATVGTEYITTYLNPRVHTVEIRGRIVANQPFYDLRLLESGKRR